MSAPARTMRSNIQRIIDTAQARLHELRRMTPEQKQDQLIAELSAACEQEWAELNDPTTTDFSGLLFLQLIETRIERGASFAELMELLRHPHIADLPIACDTLLRFDVRTVRRTARTDPSSIIALRDRLLGGISK